MIQRYIFSGFRCKEVGKEVFGIGRVLNNDKSKKTANGGFAITKCSVTFVLILLVTLRILKNYTF
jgi:hypothetical protein